MLTLSATAWLKLQYLCHAAETEVGGFGISHPSNLLYIDDIVTVKQICSPVSVEFDDAAVADFFDEQVESGRRPEQFARVWVHTHPGDSATPSPLDEQTFARVFGQCNWAVMLILACDGQTYCRLRVNSRAGVGQGNTAADDGGVSLSSVLPVHVDYESLVDSAETIDAEAWDEELKRHVHAEKSVLATNRSVLDEFDLEAFDLDEEFLEGIDPSDESLWDEFEEESEVDDDESF